MQSGSTRRARPRSTVGSTVVDPTLVDPTPPDPKQADPSEAAPVADPRVGALVAAVAGLRRALAGYRAELRDRDAAEEQLAELAAAAAAAAPDPARLRQALLLVLGALGSVSALAEPLGALRAAIASFGAPPPRP